jgi:hypothetical protein
MNVNSLFFVTNMLFAAAVENLTTHTAVMAERPPKIVALAVLTTSDAVDPSPYSPTP